MFIIIGAIRPNVKNPMEQYGYTGIWFPPAVTTDQTTGEYRPAQIYSYNSYNLARRACDIMNENRINRTGVDISEEDFAGYVVWNTEEPMADLIPFNKLGLEIFGSPKAVKYFAQPLCACIESMKLYNNSANQYNTSNSDIETVAIKYDYRLQREMRFS